MCQARFHCSIRCFNICSVKKLDIFDKTSGHFPAVVVGKKTAKLNQVNDLFLTLTIFFFLPKTNQIISTML